MALDAATLALLAQELEVALQDTRIAKINQPTKDEVLLQLHKKEGGLNLFISARSGGARAAITQEVFENPQTPPSFCMLLRKYLSGGRFLAVRSIEGERILFFDFSCTTPMRDAAGFTLAAELMGRYSNLVLINEEGKIIDALKRVDAEASALRQLLPGYTYTLPPAQGKPAFMGLTPKEVVNRAATQALPVADAMMKTTLGVGPVIYREISYRAFATVEPQADEMTDAEKAALEKEVAELQAQYKAGGAPTAVAEEGGKAVEFSFTALRQYPPPMVVTTYQTYSRLLESYYTGKDKAERLRIQGKTLARQVTTLYERAQRRQLARSEELLESENNETPRLYGELLSANLHLLSRGQPSAVLNNYYTGQPVTIPLDPRLTPAANAQKYFKDYKRKTTAVKMLERLLREGEEETRYLASVQYSLSRAQGEAALAEIRAELTAAGYLRPQKNRLKPPKPADFLRYRSSDGFEIIVGRNNLQNERLTMKTAHGADIWLHVKDAPGSHTVIITSGAVPPLKTQEEAAQIALYHSSLNGGAKAPVDYTQVRNVKKPPGTKPGVVTYNPYETVYVTVDEALVERLAQNK